MKFIQFFLGLILCALPRKILVKKFACSNPQFYFSARVAIYRIALSLKNDVNVALVPEYICNVVHRAFLEAGYTLIKYNCDDDFEPNILEIVELGKEHPKSILCLAPLYGADGGETWIGSNAGRAWREENKIFLMFDMCQDFTRAMLTTIKSEKNFALISSFNNKSFPGLMGALVESDTRDGAYRLARTSESLKLFKILAFNFLNIIRKTVFSYRKRSNFASGYEYSYCTHFPYDFSHSGAAKIQIAIGLAGKIFLSFYAAKKRGYLNNGYIYPKATPYFRSASIIISDSSSQKIIHKPPYAVHNDPYYCLKPSLKTFYFRGYDDLI